MLTPLTHGQFSTLVNDPANFQHEIVIKRSSKTDQSLNFHQKWAHYLTVN